LRNDEDGVKSIATAFVQATSNAFVRVPLISATEPSPDTSKALGMFSSSNSKRTLVMLWKFAGQTQNLLKEAVRQIRREVV